MDFFLAILALDIIYFLWMYPWDHKVKYNYQIREVCDLIVCISLPVYKITRFIGGLNTSHYKVGLC